MTTNALWLIAALLVLGLLPLLLLYRLGSLRVPLVMARKIHPRDIALSRDAWPEQVTKVSNAFDNQFQLPVLFAVGGLLALQFGPNLVELVLAWLFVLLRYVHALIHITDNHVIRRFQVFTGGLLVLTLFWLELTLRWVQSLAGGA